MKPTVHLFMIVALLWLVLSGHYTPLLLGLGLASTLLVVYLCRRMGLVDREIAPFHWTWSVLRYLPWLGREVVLSNLDVIRRVLHPRRPLPIEPQLVRVTASQKSDLGRVTYVHSITLTPGTLTVDAVDDHLVVHALTDVSAADLKSGRMDRKISSLEPAGG